MKVQEPWGAIIHLNKKESQEPVAVHHALVVSFPSSLILYQDDTHRQQLHHHCHQQFLHFDVINQQLI